MSKYIYITIIFVSGLVVGYVGQGLLQHLRNIFFTNFDSWGSTTRTVLAVIIFIVCIVATVVATIKLDA